jgi:hypothetical protein
MEIALKFTSYPTSFLTAPLFYASILPLVFIVIVTSVLAIIIWRKGGEVPESPPEPDAEGGLEEEEIEGFPDDIAPPVEPEPGQV